MLDSEYWGSGNPTDNILERGGPMDGLPQTYWGGALLRTVKYGKVRDGAE